MELKPLIDAYIRNWESYIRDLEEYKWIAFRHFKEFFYENDVPFGTRIAYSLKMTENLLVAPNYFAGGMIRILSAERPVIMEGLITTLYDEKLQFKDRIIAYMKGTEDLMWKMADYGFSDWKGRTNLQTYQDVHAISVYMSMRYPEKYYIYKFSVFKDFAGIVGYDIESKKHIDKYLEFNRLCDIVKGEIRKETAFLSVYNDWLKEKGYEDDNYCLLTQDFIYAVARHLTIQANSKKQLAKEIIEAHTKDFRQVVIEKAKSFKVSKKDYEAIDRLRRGLGLEGELWVMQYEMDRLASKGLQDIVKHISIQEGDGAGYDIESVEDDGVTPRYIEVKTTTGNCDTPFYYSLNEMEVSQKKRDHYYLYRVYDFKKPKEPARLLILNGGLDEINGIPVSYMASVNLNNK